MEYEEIIKRISKLDFIKDDQTADAAVKAVLGILAGRLDEVQARKFTEKLPEPLTLEKLRGLERRVDPITVDYYISTIGTQFALTKDQASTLVQNVLHLAKEVTGDGVLVEIERFLPSDWAEAIQKA